MNLPGRFYNLLKRSMAARIALYVALASGIGAACIYSDIPLTPKRPTHSFDWYIKAAENGDRQAQHQLGVDYDFGSEGAAKDSVKAAYWFRKAADQGDM